MSDNSLSVIDSIAINRYQSDIFDMVRRRMVFSNRIQTVAPNYEPGQFERLFGTGETKAKCEMIKTKRDVSFEDY